MTTKETLIAARDLIKRPKRWTKGGFARTSSGLLIGPAEANAVCFCPWGAIRRIDGSGAWLQSPAVAAFRRSLPDGEKDIAMFNDDSRTTHADVLAAFDRAIASE